MILAEPDALVRQNGDGYIGDIPGGCQAWRDAVVGKFEADNFSVNYTRVPLYNSHKVYAGLRDASCYTGNEDAMTLLV